MAFGWLDYCLSNWIVKIVWDVTRLFLAVSLTLMVAWYKKKEARWRENENDQKNKKLTFQIIKDLKEIQYSLMNKFIMWLYVNWWSY